MIVPPMDPYQIFARARQVWTQQRYPVSMRYTIAVRVTERGEVKSRHYHLSYDVNTGRIGVDPISDEESSAPSDGRGVTLHLKPLRQGHAILDKTVGNPGDAVDYLGVPVLSPTYSFGLGAGHEIADRADDADVVAQIRRDFNDPMPASTAIAIGAAQGTKVISSVTAFSRTYAISLAGTDDVDGCRCYHLSLVPLRDPQRFRLRQLWVDRQTFQTRQLVTAGNFTGSAAPWLVTFADIGGAMYIASETAQTPIAVGPHRYETAALSFESIGADAQKEGRWNLFLSHDELLAEPPSP